jgi:hypothetical protein
MSSRFDRHMRRAWPAGLTVAFMGTATPMPSQAAPARDMAMMAPKRVGPKAVAPVKVDGLRIEAVHWGRTRGLGQNGGYIEAFDEATGQSAWLLQVYKITNDPHMEEDVQDRFIRQLTLACQGHVLLVTDERGQCFEVELATRQVTIAGPHCAPTVFKP